MEGAFPLKEGKGEQIGGAQTAKKNDRTSATHRKKKNYHEEQGRMGEF